VVPPFEAIGELGRSEIRISECPGRTPSLWRRLTVWPDSVFPAAGVPDPWSRNAAAFKDGTMNTKKLLSLFAVAGLAMSTFALTSQVALADDPKPADSTKEKNQDQSKDTKKNDKSDKGEKGDKGDKKDKSDKKDSKAGLTAGDTAPSFMLKDLDGKEHNSSDLFKAKKATVIQWFNPDCPFVVKHYGKQGNTFNDLNTKYGKDVTFIAINSGAKGKQGAGVERNIKAKKDWKIEFPILIDEEGTVGKAYNAKNTPLMVVITPDGKVAYYGAIDDDNGADGPGKTNYVAKALDEIIAGKEVTTKTTRPYGCSVKYN
jgi:peroxiredoxin